LRNVVRLMYLLRTMSAEMLARQPCRQATMMPQRERHVSETRARSGAIGDVDAAIAGCHQMSLPPTVADVDCRVNDAVGPAERGQSCRRVCWRLSPCCDGRLDPSQRA
jgi:hypothetical protein